MSTLSKRELFRSLSQSLFTKDTGGCAVVRPPYSQKQSSFDACSQCADTPCVNACEEGIIFVEEGIGAHLRFEKSGCTYCKACFEVCEFGLLSPQHDQMINAKVKIDMIECISWNQTICFSCKDVCYDNAIDFFGMFRPTINQNCTNCGFCVSVCPNDAITIKGVS